MLEKLHEEVAELADAASPDAALEELPADLKNEPFVLKPPDPRELLLVIRRLLKR